MIVTNHVVRGTSKQRAAYDLRMEKDLSWETIGRALGVSKERARQLAHRFQSNNTHLIRCGDMKPLPCCPHPIKSVRVGG